MRHGKTPKTTRWVPSAAILGLVFQAVASAFALPAHAVQWDALAGGPFHSIVICTGRGPLRILLDAEGKPVKQPEPTGPEDVAVTCTVCCALSCGKQLGPAAIEWPLGEPRQTRFARAWPGNRIEGRSPLNRKGHDPPHSA